MDKNKKAMLGSDNKISATDNIKLSVPPMNQPVSNTPKPVVTTPSIMSPIKTQNTITAPSILNSQKLINPTMPSVFKPAQFIPQSSIPQADTIEKLKTDTNRPKGVELLKALIPTPPTAPRIQASSPKSNMSSVDNIKNNEIMLAEMDKKIKEMTGKKLQKETLMLFKPAFENIAATVNRSNETKGEKDFDSQHITVASTQSLFNLTANQLSGLPYYRMG